MSDHRGGAAGSTTSPNRSNLCDETAVGPGSLAGGQAASERARHPPSRLGPLLPDRAHPPRVRRDLPGPAERDGGHRPRRHHRRKQRPAHRPAGGLRGRRRLPRRQPLLPARPPLRTRRPAPVLRHAQGRADPRVGRAVAGAVRNAAHHRLPLHPRRPDRGDPHLRACRLSAQQIRPRDRGRRGHLGALRVPDRPHRRPGLRAQHLGRAGGGIRRLDRHQRPGRGHPAPAWPGSVTASRRTG